jgi:DNA-binding winged helix-turn-helix (wHTH) protein/tetratricopeptide (TPR) repeat protein
MRHTPETTTARYRFGARVLDVARRELRCDDIPQPLPARVFEVLHHLIAHRDRAVGRDELVRAVFGRPDVSDAQLAQVVLRARRAIGDDGQEQRAIRTVPRFGFRWAMEVEALGEEDAAPLFVEEIVEEPLPAPIDAANDDHPAVIPAKAGIQDDGLPNATMAWIPASAGMTKTRLHVAIVSAALFALSLLVAFAWPQASVRQASASTVATTSRDAIIVLPMHVEGDEAAAWARMGMMDFVVDRLRRAHQPVWSSEATLALLRTHGDALDAKRMRRDSPAAWIVESHARNLDRRWNVALTATDARGHVLTSAAHDPDLVAATRTATDRLLAAVGARSPTDAQSIPDLDERLQRAQSALLANDPETARRLLNGAPQAQRAIPEWQYRLAQVELAEGRQAEGLAITTRLLQSDATRRDPSLRAQTSALQGTLLMRLDRYADAERSYDLAITAFGDTPNASDLGLALVGRGAARMAQGRFDGALEDLGRARVALVRAGDRLAVARVDGNLGILEMQRDHPQQAVQAFAKAERDFEAMDATVELSGVRGMLVPMYLLLLQPRDALAVSDRAWAVRDHLRDPAQVADLVLARAEVLMAVGRLDEAQSLLRLPQSRAASPSDFNRHYWVELELARQRGDVRETVRLGTEALRHWPADRNPMVRAWVALRAFDAALNAGLPPPPIDDHTFAPDPLARHLGAALVARRAHDARAADAHYRDAVALAESSGVPGNSAEAVGYRPRWLLGEARVDEAAALVGRVAPWAERDRDVAALQATLYRQMERAQ